MTDVLRNYRGKSLLSRLKGALRTRSTGAMWLEGGFRFVEKRAINFEVVNSAYESDPFLGTVVDTLAAQTVGLGHYTTMNEDYEETTRDGRTAKEVVDEASERVNLDEKLIVTAREVIRSGNSFWLKIKPGYLEDLFVMPLTAIEGIVRERIEPFGFEDKPIGYKLAHSYGGKIIRADYIIHFRWNPINNNAFGEGLIERLLRTLTVNGEVRPSFLEMKARIERILPDLFEKFVGIDQVVIVPGASDEQIGEWQRILRSRPKEGVRLIWNREGADIRTVQMDPRLRFEAVLNHVMEQITIAGQTPIAKLVTTPGFTEASARAAMDMGDLIVRGIQRFIKRRIERDFYWPVIEQAGLDPSRAGVRLHWGTSERPKVTLEGLARILDIQSKTGVEWIKPNEVRRMLSKMGFELD